jgi:3-oxoacyl-[acyl-carrier protein] reductase
MDLGLQGRWALVCAGSKGLGRGCALALAAEGVHLVLNARGLESLAATADEARALGVTVLEVAGDITLQAVREAALAAAPQIDILVNNAGGPPPGDFRDWDDIAWQQALLANMLTPIALMKAVVDGMAARGFGRIVNITSGAVKAPIEVLGLSNGARAGLTGFVAGLARDARLAGRNVTVNNLLPGAFDTERLQTTLAAAAARQGLAVQTVRASREAAIPARRLGRAEEFGALCAFVCSAQAAYLTGQNLLLDGGAYPGVF